MIAFEDPNHPGNTAKHHTGKPCIEPGCENPAGTAWSPYWCFSCNVARIRRIDGKLAQMAEESEKFETIANAYYQAERERLSLLEGQE